MTKPTLDGSSSWAKRHSVVLGSPYVTPSRNPSSRSSPYSTPSRTGGWVGSDATTPDLAGAVNKERQEVEAWVADVLRRELGADLEQAEARNGCEFSLNLSQDAALLLKEAKERREAVAVA